MKNNKTVKESEIKQPDKTQWGKVISQSDSEINRNAASDPDCPVLNNKKYYKPEKNVNK